MPGHPVSDAWDSGIGDDIRNNAEQYFATVVQSVDAITGRSWARTRFIVLVAAGVIRFYEYDPDNVAAEDGVNVIHDTDDRPFVQRGESAPGADGATVVWDNDEPGTDYVVGSLWVDADSAELDVYILTAGSPLSWLDTGNNLKGTAGADGAAILTQNAAPATSYPAGSLWIDADSVDGDLYVLTGSPLAWVDTGIDMQAQDGAPGENGATIITQNDEPATSYAAGSLWIDADSADADLYVLTGSPLAWIDTGIDMQANSGISMGQAIAAAIVFG